MITFCALFLGEEGGKGGYESLFIIVCEDDGEDDEEVIVGIV